jgi:hypothetical protein
MVDLTVVDGRSTQPSATDEQIAALQFAGVKGFSLSQRQREKSLHAMAQRVLNAAYVACEFVAQDKAEIVRVLREQVLGEPDGDDRLLLELDQAIADARALLEILQSGRARIVVALAAMERG